MRYFSGSTYHRPIRRIVIVRWLALAVVYGVLGKLGTMFPYIPPSISLIWLPAGIAAAALIRWGSIMSPAIFVSACILNLSNGISPGYAAVMALGSTLGPFVIHWDLRRADFDGDFIHRADVIKFIVATLVGMTIPATVGSVCLWQLGKLPELKFAWISWWAADIVGVFLATPIILASKKNQFIKMDAQAKENLLFLLIFTLTHWLIFCSENSLLHQGRSGAEIKCRQRQALEHR